jgi:hypothetical protein
MELMTQAIRDGVESAEQRDRAPKDRGEKPRLLFALCSQFIRLGGFFILETAVVSRSRG